MCPVQHLRAQSVSYLRTLCFPEVDFGCSIREATAIFVAVLPPLELFRDALSCTNDTISPYTYDLRDASGLRRSLVVGKGAPYSTGFLRFSTRPSNAHRKCSICGYEDVSKTPLSISCGPRCASFEENTSLKRERNMTMNWSSHQ